MGLLGVTGGNAAASDEGLSVVGSDSAAIAKNGFALGSNADLVLGGVNLGGANQGTITVNGGAGVEKVAEQFNQTLSSLAGAVASSDDAEKPPAADSSMWRTVAMNVAVGLGLILLTFLLRKKQ